MATDFAESLMERTESQRTAQTPIVQIIATVSKSLDRNEAEMVLASIRREIMSGDPLVQNVTQDYTVDSFAVETASAISWEDAQNTRSMLRNALRDEGYMIEGTAVQADIQTTSL
ncbi:MAG: hypothetical protein ACOCTH_02825 [Halodesulfurarchaeum sp.]